jgi:predicted DNA-binding transcriptional regulator AlpA
MTTRSGLCPVIPRREVAALLGCSGATLKRWAKTDPEFPPAIAIGVQRVGHRADDVQRYQELMAERAASSVRTPPHDPATAGRAAAKARAAKSAALAKPAE